MNPVNLTTEQQLAELRNWAALAFQALSSAVPALETIEAESTEEQALIERACTLAREVSAHYPAVTGMHQTKPPVRRHLEPDSLDLLRTACGQIRHLIKDLTVAVDDNGLVLYVPRPGLMFSNLITALIPLASQMTMAIATEQMHVDVAGDIAPAKGEQHA